MEPGRPDLRWASKTTASAAFCLVGIMAGTGLYLSNLAYVRASNEAHVTGISPASGPAGGGTPVTITGTNLSGATVVSFGSAAGSITADSSTQITATTPPGSGTVSITVTTKEGASATSGAGQFTYTMAPEITGISPASGSAGGGTPVTITGTNLSGATVVSFGGAAGSITADSSTQITATTPPGSGTVSITVSTKGGTSGVTSADRFTYVGSPPTAYTFSASGASVVSCGDIGVVGSSHGAAVQFTFANNSSGTVQIDEVTTSGSLISDATLSPGALFGVATYAGVYYVVGKSDGGCLAVFHLTGSGKVTIT
jgi:large repetitive protein